MRLVFRPGQHLVEIAAGGVDAMLAGVFGADQAIAVATGSQHIDEHDMRQQLRDLDRIEIGAARHRPSGCLMAPIRMQL